ncbi:MAG: molybdopterin-guanine dinucleotide biosynthesis protein B [bacterium]|nr:molybdopterin-guanine dinucleotide biosynthesis protein B [bacterium]
MNTIHIVGRQNNGKTTMLVELIEELTGRGLTVGTIKHSSHVHELDKPGKDSFRHREAGSNPTAIVTANQVAVYLPREENKEPLDQIKSLYADTDLILIEGYIDGPGIKVEVWRKEMETQPLIFERGDITAVITDDDIDTDLPILPRKDIAAIGDAICKLAGITK